MNSLQTLNNIEERLNKLEIVVKENKRDVDSQLSMINENIVKQNENNNELKESFEVFSSRLKSIESMNFNEKKFFILTAIVIFIIILKF